MQRIDKIDDLLDQIRAAVFNCKNELHEKGESESLKAFVHTLNLITQTLEEFVEHLKPHIEDEEEIAEIEERHKRLRREADALIEKINKSLTK